MVVGAAVVAVNAVVAAVVSEVAVSLAVGTMAAAKVVVAVAATAKGLPAQTRTQGKTSFSLSPSRTISNTMQPTLVTFQCKWTGAFATSHTTKAWGPEASLRRDAAAHVMSSSSALSAKRD